jgi:hypothetical protein
MDKLTHISITNCIKELDALKLLLESEQFSTQEVADWLTEISWNLSNIFRRRRYNSDEFQRRSRQLVVDRKRAKREEDKAEDSE